MLNVPELEQRWKRYRHSRRLPFLIGTGVVVLTLSAGLYFLLTPGVFTAKPQAAATPPQPQSASAAADGKTAVKLAPSMGFMQTFESDVIDHITEESTPRPQPKVRPKTVPALKPAVKQSVPSVAAAPQEEVVPFKAVTTQPETLPSIRPGTASAAPVRRYEADSSTAEPEVSSSQMTIRRDDDMKDIQDVVARFKKNKNPVLSLFIAKRYYNIGNYQQAYNYALITNELDSSIEDSWLIFAKSLYKMKQKEMAIKTLKSYIQESNSVKAKIALDQMESGTIE